MLYTKKTFIINGLYAIALFSITGTAYANYPAPTMRGELLHVNAPAGAIDLSTATNPPIPKTAVGNIQKITTVLIPQSTSGAQQLDVTLIDDFIDDISPNARHYPTNFPSRTTQYNASENIKHLSAWLEPYAKASNASFDVLLRAVKINAMGRNLNLGTDYGVRASTYVARALKLQPQHAEANFLYGAMLSEGGGFNEGKKYLDKAAAAGYLEAEQSLAQSDLLNDNRSAALSRLERLANTHPNNAQITEQLRIVQNGGYYIWDIKDDDVHVKSVSAAPNTPN
ncbi:MAG: hypothetical protein Q4G13_06035 [Moraxella sp.]|nr:hypothetical protein [Moraxella sp.]